MFRFNATQCTRNSHLCVVYVMCCRKECFCLGPEQVNGFAADRIVQHLFVRSLRLAINYNLKSSKNVIDKENETIRVRNNAILPRLQLATTIAHMI